MKPDRRPQACAVCGAARPHQSVIAWMVHNRAEEEFFKDRRYTLHWHDGEAEDTEKGLTVTLIRQRYPEVVGLLSEPHFRYLHWDFGQTEVRIWRTFEKEEN